MLLQSFPNLYTMLQSLGSDNNMVLRADPQWDIWINYPLLEYQATALIESRDSDYDLIETFINGEESDAKKIADRYHLHALSEFLNSAFDGDLNSKFFL